MIIRKVGDHYECSGTVGERVYLLKSAQAVYVESREASTWRKRKSQDVNRLTRLWKSGLFTVVSLSELSGVTPKTLRSWVDIKPKSTRVRGRIQPSHFPVLISRLSAQRGEVLPDSGEVIDQMVREGSDERLIRAVLGELKSEPEKKRGNKRGTGPVRTELRPDDQGHPSGSEEVGEDLHTDQDDDKPGASTGVIEPFDFGFVQAAPESDEATERPAAEVQGELPVYSHMDAQGRRVVVDVTGTEITGDEWDPLEGFEFDEGGDSLLLGSEDEGRGAGLPGLPAVGAPWDLAEEA